jgi:lysozyme
MTDAEKKEIRDFVIKHEGVRSLMYYDSLGIPTIGVGFNLLRDDAKERVAKVGGNYNSIATKKSRLDPNQISALLDLDIDDCVKDLRALFTAFDAMPLVVQKCLVDLRFNLGPTRFRGFPNTIADFKKGDYKSAARRLSVSKWAGQVGKRATEIIGLLNSVG